MKNTHFRKSVSLVLILLFVLSAIPVFAATEPTTFRTSYDPDIDISFSLSGTNITISGKIPVAGLEKVWVRSEQTTALTQSSIVFDLQPGESFTVTMPVVGDRTPIQIFVKTSYSGGNFMSYIYNMVYAKKKNGSYVFELSPVYDKNKEKFSKWANPSRFMIGELAGMDAFEAQFYISYERLEAVHTSRDAYVNELKTTIATLKKLAGDIIGSETSRYEQIRKLSNWVSENVYYDYDYTNGRSDKVYYYPLDVIREKRSTCDGYCRLLNALLRSIGIPSRIFTTYSLTIGGAETFDGLTHEANHAIVSAYLDGRWILLDPTWDSGNAYEFGEFKKSPMVANYFDVSLEKLSSTHEIIECPCSDGEDEPSSWAQPEVGKAIVNGIVPSSLQCGYRNSATREQFCTLIISMMMKYTGKDSIPALLSYFGKEAATGLFSDTSNEYVNAASVLGVVNGTGVGKFSPNSPLTREQAATMLSRAASILGIVSNGEGVQFADEAEISSWAKDSVKFISSLVSSEGTKVMGGVGDNRFSPKGSYTIEQSILTVYRIFMCK